MLYQIVLDEFVAVARTVMGEGLTGVYLHGSMAMGCFNPQKSDIDLIVVIEETLSDAQKMAFMKRVIALNEQAPAKGLEISVVKRACCKPFCYPTPYELHFSPMHLAWFQHDPQDYIAHMKGVDKDLAAHFTIIGQYGISLWGEKIETVFAEVPAEAYFDSIWEDVKNAQEDIVTSPLYTTLNLCRVLAFLQEGLVLSKQTGGKWAMTHLSTDQLPVVSAALACYGSDREMVIEKTVAQAFAGAMLGKIKQKSAQMII